MEPSAYEHLARSEDAGWYYRARIKAVEALLARFAPNLDRSRKILDVGCGTGGSTQKLRKYGEVTGIEPSPHALRLARQKHPDLKIYPLRIEDLSPVTHGSFDIVTMLCVLYHRHIKDPREAVASLAKLQEKGGILVWNEPAYPLLSRQHDHQTMGSRRFMPKEMEAMLKAEGYEVIFRSHLLAWAFPLATTLGFIDRRRQKKQVQINADVEGTDHRPVPKLLNKFLMALTYLEWSLSLYRLGFKFGVSFLLVARKS